MYKNLELGAILAKGGSGVIQEAFHSVTGMPLVIKTSKKDQFSLREAYILPSLNHPNIVRCIHTQVTDKEVCLVLERALDGDLQMYLGSREKLPEQDARAFFLQLIEVVSYLHSRNIAHRDIKLENLLLHEGKIILADLEFSFNYKPDNVTQQPFLGTLEYTSPEVRYGKYVGPEVDIWAMGVVLYKLVTRKFPFRRSELQTLKEKLFLPPHLSLWCRDLLARLLHPTISERLTIEAVKKHPWITQDYTNPPFSPEQLLTSGPHIISSETLTSSSSSSGSEMADTPESPSSRASSETPEIQETVAPPIYRKSSSFVEQMPAKRKPGLSIWASQLKTVFDRNRAKVFTLGRFKSKTDLEVPNKSSPLATVHEIDF